MKKTDTIEMTMKMVNDEDNEDDKGNENNKANEDDVVANSDEYNTRRRR